jgi:predicted house-cleaning noncanonical NTP pyrophosphatase (MazG superfamily)
MIKVDKRNAVFALHNHGVGIRAIARQLKMDRNTVREIIKNEGQPPTLQRCSQIVLAKDLLEKLFLECEGYIQRMHERLTEEHQVKIAYSTLTRKIRDLNIDPTKNRRCGQVPDVAGQEMQQDTSPYRILISNQKMKLIASLIYLRYSKLKYLKFYPSFCRFQMKCFFYEALTFWKYTAPRCVIDNTNLAVLHGTGPDAVFVPEMISFGDQFGFKWFAHKKGHSNRKAGNERSFWTVETNFLKGRTFSSIEDLNQQAFEWATGRNAHRPLSKSGLIPIELFEMEKQFLKKLPPYLPAPYLQHERDVDQYGYTAFNANYYWIPGASLEKVIILEYAGSIKIFRKHSLLIEYRLPSFGVKNKKIKPDGIGDLPFEPRHRPKPTQEEELKLKSLCPEVGAYLDVVDRKKPSPQKRNQLIRRLYCLNQTLTEHFFIQTLRRATHYRVIDVEQLERIAFQLVRLESYEVPVIDSHDEELEDREAYQEGKITWSPDPADYETLLNQRDEEE